MEGARRALQEEAKIAKSEFGSPTLTDYLLFGLLEGPKSSKELLDLPSIKDCIVTSRYLESDYLIPFKTLKWVEKIDE